MILTVSVAVKIRPKMFPNRPFEIGADCKFFIAISWNSKEKQTFQWKFHENGMKNNKVMTK